MLNPCRLLAQCLVAATTVFRQTPAQMPQMRELNGRRVLFVDDKPFLILGLQWDCDTPFSSGVMHPEWAYRYLNGLAFGFLK